MVGFAKMRQLINESSERIQNKYMVYTKDLRGEHGMDYIPVYMTMFL